VGSTKRSTSGDPGELPNQEQTGISVAEKLDQSLPQLDINLVSDIKIDEHDSQPMNDELRRALDASAARRPRGRGRRIEQDPIELDPAYLQDPQKMNYALLLALLLREGGVVKLAQRDLERADDEHSILFALSLDGKQLEVSAINTESGIIRSPEAKWATSQIHYAPPPRPGVADPPQFAVDSTQTQNPASQSFLPPRVVEMPAPQEIRPGTPPAPQRHQGETAAAGQPGYVFPFETGQSPQSATMNLDTLQSELAKDRMLAQEQQRAIAKVEGG